MLRGQALVKARQMKNKVRIRVKEKVNNDDDDDRKA